MPKGWNAHNDMDIGNLIRMANRIGDFFVSLPDQAEGVEGIANHIQKFWEPRMRRQILDFLAEHPDGVAGQDRMSPIVLAAISQNIARLTPKTTTPPPQPGQR
jgi:formate dehydrogenase subunit delta